MAHTLLSRAMPPALFRSALLQKRKVFLPPVQKEGGEIMPLQVNLPPHAQTVVQKLSQEGGNPVLRNLRLNIQDTPDLSKQVKQALLSRSLEVVLLMVGNPIKEEAVERCLLLLPKSGEEKQVAHFLAEFYDNLMEVWVAQKPEFSEVLNYMGEALCQEQHQWCAQTSLLLAQHLGPVPSYLSREQEMRLLVVCMLPEADRLVCMLPKWVVRREWVRHLRGFRPHPELWYFLCTFLPSTPRKRPEVLKTFEQNIWNLHQPSKASVDLKGRVPVIQNPNPDQLVAQLFTFLMGNWEELWKWGRRWELQRRLLRLRPKWNPDPKLLLSLILCQT